MRFHLLALFMALTVLALPFPDQAGKSKANVPTNLVALTTPAPATKETPKPAPTTPPKEVMIDDWIHHLDRCRHCGAKLPDKKISWYDSWIDLSGRKKGKKQD